MSPHTCPVRQVIVPQNVLEGAGVRLKRSFPTYLLDFPDPFLLFDHFGSDNPADYLAGFPTHPHRGIETVTYMLEGAVAHRDSLGNSGVIGAGDVQWMTAGRGILHEEMPKGVNGRMEGFQLWVNLPAYLKMTRPSYQEIPAKAIPVLRRKDGSIVRLIAGELDGVIGPVEGIAADPVYMDVELPPDSTFSLPVDAGQTALAYLFRGQASFEEPPPEGDEMPLSSPLPAAPLAYGVPPAEPPDEGWLVAPKLLLFGEGERLLARTASEAARFLVFLGRAMHEPIVRYGPFVMNTREEIEDTLRDLRSGTFIR
jgi:hypothetical protein